MSSRSDFKAVDKVQIIDPEHTWNEYEGRIVSRGKSGARINLKGHARPFAAYARFDQIKSLEPVEEPTTFSHVDDMVKQRSIVTFDLNDDGQMEALRRGIFGPLATACPLDEVREAVRLAGTK